MDTLKAYWLNLSDRDRIVASIGGAIIAILLLYLLIWHPLSTAVSSAKQRVQSQQRLLQYLKTAEQHILQLKSQGITIGAAPTGDLLSLVEQSLAAHQLTSSLKQVEQPKPTAISLTFSGVQFDQLMAWLETIVERDHLSVKSLTATRLSTVGVADVVIVLGA